VLTNLGLMAMFVLVLTGLYLGGGALLAGILFPQTRRAERERVVTLRPKLVHTRATSHTVGWTYLRIAGARSAPYRNRTRP
jgi:hypothetical protein